MMRAIWKGALLAVVASAGVAWGQPVLLPGAGAQPRERTVTLQQKDGLPEPCRVLKTWTTPEGRTAYLLQSLDTGEMLTVVQKGSAKGGAAQVGATIYRWSNGIVPPKGSPSPPPDGGIRQAAYTTEAPPPLRPIVLPRVATVSVMADVSSAPPAPVAVAAVPVEAAVPAVSCASGGCDKARWSFVHRFEKPPSIAFLPGNSLPVCAPEHAPNYGFYRTQWRPWPVGDEMPVVPVMPAAPAAPVGERELLGPPKSSEPLELP